MVRFVTGSSLGVNSLYVILQATSWQTALAAARDLGADLAVISSAEEQAQISSKLTTLAAQNPAAVNGDILFGLQPRPTGGYKWSNGETFYSYYYSSWAAGEPNLSPDYWSNTADAVVLSAAHGYSWNDVVNTTTDSNPAYQNALAELPLRQFGAYGYTLITASDASDAAVKAGLLGGTLADTSNTATTAFLKTFLSAGASAWVANGEQLSHATGDAQAAAPSKALVAIPLPTELSTTNSIYIQAVHWPEVREYQQDETLTIRLDLNQPLKLSTLIPGAGINSPDLSSSLPLIANIKFFEPSIYPGYTQTYPYYSQTKPISQSLNAEWDSEAGLSSIAITFKGGALFSPYAISQSQNKYISISLGFDLDGKGNGDGMVDGDIWDFSGWQLPPSTSIDLTLPAADQTSPKGYTAAPINPPPTTLTSIAISSGQYEAGQTINIEANFSQPIYSYSTSNSSTISLEIGTKIVEAIYNPERSKPDAKKLVYSYTIPFSSPADSDGVRVVSWNNAQSSFGSSYYDANYESYVYPALSSTLPTTQELTFNSVTVQKDENLALNMARFVVGNATGGSSLYMVLPATSWATALESARWLGADLAVISSAEEQAQISSKLTTLAAQNPAAVNGDILFGLQPMSTGGYQWSNGDWFYNTYHYGSWAAGEPNLSPNYWSNTADAVVLSATHGYSWNDVVDTTTEGNPAYQSALAELPLRQFGGHGYALITASDASDAATKAGLLGGTLAAASDSATTAFLKTFLSAGTSAWVANGSQLSHTTGEAQTAVPNKALVAIPLATEQISSNNIYIQDVHWPAVREYQWDETLTIYLDINQPLKLIAPTLGVNTSNPYQSSPSLPLISTIKFYDQSSSANTYSYYSFTSAVSSAVNPTWSSEAGLSTIAITFKPEGFSKNSSPLNNESGFKHISISLTPDFDGYGENDYYDFSGWQIAPTTTSLDFTLPATDQTSGKGYSVAPLSLPPTALTAITVSSGDYGTGQTIHIEAILNRPVYPYSQSNTSTISLEIGANIFEAVYNSELSNPSANKLVYSYTIPLSGPADSDGIRVVSWNKAQSNFDSSYYDPNYASFVNPALSSTLPTTQGLTFSGVTVHNANVVGNENTPQLLANTLTITQGETKQLTSADLNASDADTPENSGQLRFQISASESIHFERSDNGINWLPVTSFTVSEITAGKIRVSHDGSENKPAFTISVSDGSKTSPSSQATITYTGINDSAPTLTLNRLTLLEGSIVPLSAQNFAASDLDQYDSATTISFQIHNLEGGSLEVRTNEIWTETTSFTAQDLRDGNVRFIDDGDEIPPSFSTSVSDGERHSTASSPLIEFVRINDSIPAITAKTLFIKKGAVLTLTPANLAATDADSSTWESLSYQIQNLEGGRFERKANSGIWETSNQFTNQDIQGQLVRFVDDGDDNAPSFSIQVSDGVNTSASTEAKIIFNLRVPQLVDDINTSSYGSDPQYFAKSGEYLYFVAHQGNNRNQLWRTTASTGIVELLQTSDGVPYQVEELVDINGRLYCRGYEPTIGTSLYQIDASTGATLSRVAGTDGKYPSNFKALGKDLFFTSEINGTNSTYIGRELSRLDSTTGLISTYDLYDGWNSSYPRSLTIHDSKLFFVASAAGSGEELWCFDPSIDQAPKLLRDIRPGAGSSSISNLITSGGRLYFTASTGIGNTDEELWQTDGTANGTSQVVDINRNSYGSDPTPILHSGNNLYFTATSDANGLELYRLDPASGTLQLIEIQAGTSSSQPGGNYGGLVDLNGTLYFSAYDSSNGWNLWRTRPEGTLQQLTIGSSQSNPQFLTAVGDTLYFAADGTNNLGVDLSRDFTLNGEAVSLSFDLLRLDSWDGEKFMVFIDGQKVLDQPFSYWTAETLVRNGSGSGYSWTIEPISDNDEKGFWSYPDQLFRVTISIPAGHNQIKLGLGSSLNEGSDNESYGLRNLTVRSSSDPSQIRLSEPGTDASAWIGGRVSSSPTLGTFIGRYSSEANFSLGRELWSINASSGEAKVIDINTGLGSSDPQALFNVGGKLYFTAYTPSSGYELWSVDPADNIPHLVADLNPGADSSRAWWNYGTTTVVAVGERVYFSAAGSQGQELYMLAPELASAQLIDLHPGLSGSSPHAFTVAGERLFFKASDGNGVGLFSTDPQTGSASRLTVPSLNDTSNVDSLLAINGRLYFRNNATDENGITRGLYSVDPGSGIATRISNIHSVDALQVSNGQLFFKAYTSTGLEGYELFRLQPESLSQTPELIEFSPGPSPYHSYYGYPEIREIKAVSDSIYALAYGKAAQDLYRTLELPGEAVKLSFEFLRLDSWDNESLHLYINGEKIIEQKFSTNPTSDVQTGSRSGFDWTITPISINEQLNGSGSYDQIFKITVSIPSGHSSIDFGLGSTLDQPTEDESYGIRNLEISTIADPAQLLLRDPGDNPSLWTGGRTSSNATLGTFLGVYGDTREWNLWKLDPSELNQTMRPLLATSLPNKQSISNLFSIGNTLYFSYDNGIEGRELWQTDGTTSGTRIAANVNGQTLPSSPRQLTNVDGKLYFTADDGIQGRGLYVLNTQTGLVERKNIPGLTKPNSSASIDSLTSCNGRLFFRGNTWNDSSTTYRPLYVLDPISGEAQQISGVHEVDGLTSNGGQLFFTAYSANYQEGYELFRIAANSTIPQLIEVNPGGLGSYVQNVTSSGESIYFTAERAGLGRELFRLDSNDQAVPLRDIAPGATGSNPRSLFSIGSTTYFIADDQFNGTELWQTDGTENGTRLTKNINNITLDSTPNQLIDINGILYFTAIDGALGRGLYRIDPASGNPERLAIPGLTGGKESAIDSLTNANGRLYFRSNSYNNTSVYKPLYALDGSTGEISAINGVRDVDNIRYYDGQLYFTAQTTSGQEGYELFRIGSGSGTPQLIDINTGAGSSDPSQLTVNNGTLYFSAYANAIGRELYRLDSNFRPAPLANLSRYYWSELRQISSVANRLYFNQAGSIEAAGPGQDVSKTFTLDATSTTISFDFQHNDSWDNEWFTVYIDDAPIFSKSFNHYSATAADAGSSGEVSWSLTPSSELKDLYGITYWYDQRFTIELTLPAGRPNVKLGFSSSLDEDSGNESYFIDNLKIRAADQSIIANDDFINADTWLGGRISTDSLGESVLGPYGRAAAVSESWRLWSVNPSNQKIQPVAITGVDSTYDINSFVSLGNRVFFRNSGWTASGYNTLYTIDPTNGDAIQLEGLRNIYSILAAGPSLYLIGSYENQDNCLIRVDGNANISVVQLQGGGNPGNLTKVGEGIYFTAHVYAPSNNWLGVELWKVDNVSGGARLIEINPGYAGSNPRNLLDVNGTLYLIAQGRDNEVYTGEELYRVDPITDQVELMADVYPGSNSSYPANLTLSNGQLYFTATDGSHGQELWRVPLNNQVSGIEVSRSVAEDQILLFTVDDFATPFAANGGGNLQAVKILSLPGNGKLLLDGNICTVNQTIASEEISRLSFKPDANYNGTAAFNWSGSTGNTFANQPSVVRLAITAVADAPEIKQPLGSYNIYSNRSDGYTFDVNSFRDADLDQSLSYTATLADGSKLPSWITLNGRSFSFNPPLHSSGSYDIRVTATDREGLTSQSNSTPIAAVNWLDWTAADVSQGIAIGTFPQHRNITASLSSSAPLSFAQTDGGINYFNPSGPYSSAGVTAPSSTDIIAFYTGGSRTLTFSQPINDIYLAYVSINNNTLSFDHDFEIISQSDEVGGAGYFGAGKASKLQESNGLENSYQLIGQQGEPHGVIKFAGPISSLTWTSNTEYWNGFTIGSTDPNLSLTQPDSILTLTVLNAAPQDIRLTTNTIQENSGNGTVVGSFLVTDSNSNDQHTLSLVDSAGGRFALDPANHNLIVADGSRLDYEAASSHNISVRAIDPTGLSIDRNLTIYLTNVNDSSAGALSFSSSHYSVRENGQWQQSITITRENGSDGGISAGIRITPGSALYTSDYGIEQLTILFGSGEQSKTIEIPIVNDSLKEYDEQFRLELLNPSNGATLGSQRSATVTIQDDDLVPSLELTINDLDLSEGQSSIASISRNTSTAEPLLVNLSSGNRLTMPPTITIPAGDSTATFTITVPENTLIEETDIISLSASAHGHQGATKLLTIIDNDTIALSLHMQTTRLPENAGTVLVTLSRSPQSDQPLTVLLSSNNPMALQMPNSVVIPANQSVLAFEIKAIDDQLANQDQSIIITAKPTYSNTTTALGSGLATLNLTIIEDDSAKLDLKINKDFISESGQAIATVTRNTETAAELLIDLSNSDPGEASIPTSVLIPAGERSVSFMITGISDGESDGSQTVSITATAAGLVSASQSLIVTDLNVADLSFKQLEATQPTFTSAISQLSYAVINHGIASATGTWKDRVYLSSDDKLDAKDTLLGEYIMGGEANQASLQPDLFYSRTASFYTPRTPGQYYLIGVTDYGDTVDEGEDLGENNNSSVSAVSILPAYRGIAETETDIALPGQAITLRGKALSNKDNTAVSYEFLKLRISNNGVSREFDVLTDASGNFSRSFYPLPDEAGPFAINAYFPTNPNEDDAPEDSFTLLGMRFEKDNQLVNQLHNHIIEGSSLTGSLKLQNLSAIPLTNLSATVGGAPDDWTINLMLRENNLSGNGEIQLDYNIAVPDDRWSYYDFSFNINSNEGINIELPVHIDVGRLLPRLVASSSSLQAAMLRGSQRTIEFEISNQGDLPTGPLSLNLPSISWLKAASSTSLPSLAPGESTRVTLLLQPSATEALQEFQGSLSLTGTEVTLNLPFRFRAVSEAQGSLSVNVADELTRFAAGSPLVENATITLSDPYTGAIISSEQDADGTYTKANLTEGYYKLRVSADRHDSYEKTILISAGETTNIDAFLSRQTVKYVWTVTPTEIEDRYVIHIESVFETNVPIPTVVIEPAFLDLADLQVVGQEMQVDITATNHGLIDAKAINFNFGDHPFYKIEALINNVDTLAAKSSISIPVRVTRVADFNTLTPAAGELAIQSSPQVPCNISGSIDYSYECAGEDITRDIPLPILNVEGNCSSTAIGGTPWWPRSGGFGGGNGGSGGGGGGGSTYVVPVEVVQQDNNCDPCKEKNLQALSCIVRGLGGKAKGVIGAVVGGINCWVNIANGIKDFKEGNYTELPKPGEICDPPEIPDCLENLCLEGLGFGSSSTSPATAGPSLSISSLTPSNINAGLQTLYRYKGYWDVIGEVSLHYYGSEVWLKVSEAEQPRLRDWMQAFRSRLGGTSIDDFKISAQERLELLAIDYPQPLTAADIDQFLARWNRSIDYFNAGILRRSDLNANQNPDFIAIDALENLSTALNTYKSALQQEGYQDLDDATYTHSKELYDAISGQAGVCAQVKIRIDQEAVMTRTAFLGSLEIKNGNPFSLTNLTVIIEIKDQFGNLVNDKFGITDPVLRNISAVDGSGVLPGDNPDTAQDEGIGSAQWTFIPTNLAAPTVPTEYSIGGTLSYIENGKNVVVPLATSSPVTVYPQAELHLDYFHQRDVYSDDPFTDDIIETSVPYSLAVLIRNEGKGDAKNLRITSGQPKIIENEKGLLIDFQIIGSEVNGEGATPSLTVNFGDIKAGKTGVAEWLLKSSLQGKFVDYKATFEHVNSLGKAELSLIKNVNIHELIHTVNVDHPLTLGGINIGGDGLSDFLVNDVFDAAFTPDTVYFSSGGTAPVQAITLPLIDAFPSISDLEVELTAITENGWSYFRLPEPSNNSLDLIGIRRADGSTLNRENFWITDRTFPGTGRPTYENVLHFLDATSSGEQTYTLIYQPGGPEVADIIDVSPNPRSTAINTITVDFSEPIQSSSFDHGDLILSLDQGNNLINANITIVALSPTRYQISGLSSLTSQDGAYSLTVNASGIADSSGKYGIGSLSESWIKAANGSADLIPLVVTDVVDLLVNPRNQVVSSLTINLSKPVDLSSFSWQDLSLTRNDGPNLISSSVTISALTETSYRVNGLSTFTSFDGSYLFSVTGNGLSDLSGNAGSGLATESWLMDTLAPTAPTNLKLLTPEQHAAFHPQGLMESTSSSGQLIIASMAPILTGQLAESGLRVFVYDSATDQLLRQADVQGASFSAKLALPGPGARDLRIDVHDQAGNITTSTLSIFADTARPVLIDFPGLSLPSNSPRASIDVRFSEPIDLGSFDLQDIKLSKDGIDLTLPSTVLINHVGSSTYRISGLSELAASVGSYLLKVDTRGILDTAGNAGETTAYGEFLITPPPTVGISVLDIFGTTIVKEGGYTKSYRLVLNTQPSSDVSITLSTSNQLMLSSNLLVFTPDNWRTPQTITISAVDDGLIEGDHMATILQTISSSDAAYATISLPPLNVQLADNDAGLSGRIWHDINGNSSDDTEPPLANWTVYLDTNNNHQLDAGEISTLTDASGLYSFMDLRPGIYNVAQVVPAGWHQTYPLIPITTTAADSVLSIPSLDFTLDPQNGNAILNFSAPDYRVSESGAALTEILVNRSGNLSSTVSATIQLSDGTAIGCGCAATSVNNDFNYAPIFINFAPGEVSKRITVQDAVLNQNNTLRIRNDSKIEDDEYFTIGLVQASAGAQIGSQATARVVIQDDDIAITDPQPPTRGETPPSTTVSSSGVTNPTDLLNLQNFWADARFASIKGAGQSIVVIDTGADLDHSLFGTDLNLDGIADRIRFQYDFADRDADASDHNNHGSHVASIAAALAPQADLIILKVFKDSGSGSFADLEQALQWVYTNADAYNIAAVNLSLGDNLNWPVASSQYGIGDELAAIASRNIITAAAAGNGFYSFGSVPGLSYPAADPSVISVGAVWGSGFGTRIFSNGAIDYSTAAGQIASFSQRHPLLDVFAPGILISGASADGGITTMGGTSQAVPFLTALVSLAQNIATHYLNRRLSLSEFDHLLQSSGDVIFDGDDEDDNVENTQADYRRLNLIAFAEAILQLDSSSNNTNPSQPDPNGDGNDLALTTNSFSHSVTLDAGEILSGLNFGTQQLLSETPLLAISPAGLVQPEGSGSNKIYSFSVTRSGDASGVSSVNWSVVGIGSTPASANDFVGGRFPSGTIVFAAGETSTTINIEVAGDLEQETDESFLVKLDAAIGATLDPAAWNASGAIINDDSATPASVNLSIPANLTATIGNMIEIPINIDNPTGVLSLDLIVEYDPLLLSPDPILPVSTGNLTTGDLISGAWTFNYNATTPGRLVIGGYGLTPLAAAPGSIATLRLHVKPGISPGQTTLDLVEASLNEDQIDVNLIDNNLTLKPASFQVLEVRQLASGFAVKLSDTPDLTTLNLYDGIDSSIDASDMQLTGPDGKAVSNVSLHWQESSKELYLLRSDSLTGISSSPFQSDLLAPGSYNLSIDSRLDGLMLSGDKPLAERMLDGNGDGISGDAFSHSFAAISTPTHLIAIADTARAPGQALSLNGNGSTNGNSGLPVLLTTATALTSLSGNLHVDGAAISNGSLVRGSALPADWNLEVTPTAGGGFSFTAFGPTPIQGNDLQLLRFTGSIAATASYGSTSLIQVSVNSPTNPVLAFASDPGLVAIAFAGDATGNGRTRPNKPYSSLDASFIQRVQVGLDTGFDAYPLIAPPLIADLSGNGRLSSLDASLLQQRVVGLPVSSFPQL